MKEGISVRFRNLPRMLTRYDSPSRLTDIIPVIPVFLTMFKSGRGPAVVKGKS
jgi:hypothetical protein